MTRTDPPQVRHFHGRCNSLPGIGSKPGHTTIFAFPFRRIASSEAPQCCGASEEQTACPLHLPKFLKNLGGQEIWARSSVSARGGSAFGGG